MNVDGNRRSGRWLMACIAIAMLAQFAAAQDDMEAVEESEGPRPARRDLPKATEVPTEGFWPTDRLLQNMFDRIAEDMSERYKFDEDQAERVREILGTDIPAWLKENRAELQSLTNQYFEALTAGSPPTPEDVAVWSQRMLPLVEEFTQVIKNSTGEMKEFLDEGQVMQMDQELAAFDVGVRMMSQKLNVWAEGGYDPEVEWIRSPNQEEQRRRAAEDRARLEAEVKIAKDKVEFEGATPEQASAAAAKQAAGERDPENVAPQTADAFPAEGETTVGGAGERRDPKSNARKPADTAEIKDEWSKYVDEFVKKYQLNDGQEQKVRGFLRDKRTERDNYLRKYSEAIEAALKKTKAAKTPEETESAKAEYNKLNAPVDRMFNELKDKMKRIPNRAQRKAAAEREPKADSAKPTDKAAAASSQPSSKP